MTGPGGSDAALVRALDDAYEGIGTFLTEHAQKLDRNGYSVHASEVRRCLSLLAAAAGRADEAETQLRDLRRQMEELRERGVWPVSKMEAALLAAQQERDDDYRKGYAAGVRYAEVRAEATVTRLRQRDDWLGKQLTNCIADAEGLRPAALARVLSSDLRDALAALAQDTETK